MKKLKGLLLVMVLSMMTINLNSIKVGAKDFIYDVRNDDTSEIIFQTDEFYLATDAAMRFKGKNFTIIVHKDNEVNFTGVFGNPDDPRNLTITSGPNGPYTIKKSLETQESSRNHIAVSRYSTLTLKDIILDGQNYYGGISMAEDTVLTLESGATIQNNKTIEYNKGAGIDLLMPRSLLIMKEGSKVINNLAITKHDSYGGGGIYVGTEAEFIMEGGLISGNVSRSSGGGILSFGKVTIKGGEISRNCALGMGNSKGLGGGIYSDGNLTIDNSKFTFNKATDASGKGYGGGLYIKMMPRYQIQS